LNIKAQSPDFQMTSSTVYHNFEILFTKKKRKILCRKLFSLSILANHQASNAMVGHRYW